MAENESGQDKTEEATGKKKQDAKDKGEIVRSKELNTLLLLFASGGGLLFFGGNIVSGLMDMLRDSFTISRAEMFDPTAMVVIFARMVESGFDAVIPLFLLLTVAAILAPLALGGWSFALKPLEPDLKKMDPIKGIPAPVMASFRVNSRRFIITKVSRVPCIRNAVIRWLSHCW